MCFLEYACLKELFWFLPHILPLDIKMLHVEFFPSISSGEVLTCQPGKLYAILFAKLLWCLSFFSYVFFFRAYLLLLPLSDSKEYLPRSWEFPGRTKKAELEGQKPHLQLWRETESPSALPCSAQELWFHWFVCCSSRWEGYKWIMIWRSSDFYPTPLPFVLWQVMSTSLTGRESCDPSAESVLLSFP